MKTALMIAFLFLGQNYNIELAITPTEQATGLMYRKSWDETSQGMLFVNKKERQVSFWMKNTYLNMTIFYLDQNFNIVEVHYPTPLSEKGMLSKSNNINYVLELNPSYENTVHENWNDFKKELQKALLEKNNEISRLQN